MKSLLSILLLVITSVYMLPVKNIFTQKATVCWSDMEEEKAEKDKGGKEKIKELLSPYNSCYILKSFTNSQYYFMDRSVNNQAPPADTPPPDFI